MKAIRTIALFLCVIFASSMIYQARAEDVTAASSLVPGTLEQCASELSQCTSYKYYKSKNTERYINYRLIHMDYTPDAIITYVNIGLDRLFYTNPVEITNPNSTSVLVNKYRPLPPGFIPLHIESISSKYGYGAQKLTHSARLAFEKLCAGAKKYGYPIWAVSSYRTYEKQAQVYASFLDQNNPDSALTRDLLAAKPGYSEHQTGLAVDISRVDASVSIANTNKWMANNAHKYGFIIRYPAGKEGITGVTNEPWHLRYLGVKLATTVYNCGTTYDEYYAREIDIPATSAEATAIGVTAVSNITVDGIPHQLSAYRVLGETYYKLRDIAVILNGTPKAFDVIWNSEAKRIELRTGVPYSSDLTLGVFEAGRAALVTAAKPTLSSNEATYDTSAYSAGGSNYFKLADIMNILGITVTDDGTGNPLINTVGTPISLSAETPAPIT